MPQQDLVPYGGPLLRGVGAGYNAYNMYRKYGPGVKRMYDGGYRLYQKYKRSQAYKKRKRPPFQAAQLTYIPKGSSAGKKLIKRRRKVQKRKVSLKKKVDRLIKNMPKDSYKHIKMYEPVTINVSGNTNKWHWCPVFDNQVMSNELASVNVGIPLAQDLSGEDSNKIWLKNRFMKFHFRNSRTSPLTVQVIWVKCKVDQATQPLAKLSDGWQDRGLTVTNTVQLSTPASASTAFQPSYLELPAGELFYTVSEAGSQFSKNWSVIGQKTCRLDGGDEFIDTCSLPDKLIHVSDFDEVEAYKKDYDCGAIIRVMGVLSHDETNNDIVGFGIAGMDGFCYGKQTIKVSGIGGADKIEYTDQFNLASIPVPVFAGDDQEIRQSER